jgi:hypothetical protein
MERREARERIGRLRPKAPVLRLPTKVGGHLLVHFSYTLIDPRIRY